MRRRAALLVVALASVGLCGVERPRGLGDVVEVRHWSYPDYTRVVVELTQPVGESEVVHLDANPAANRPERLYLDLEGVWVGRRYVDGVRVGDGLLEAVRLGQNTLKRTRVVIDVANYQRHRLLTLTHPHRLVVDVYGRRAGEGALGSQEGGGGDVRLPAGMRSVRTIVLDAGHGGRDPGAIGIGGLREKDVTLRLARMVGEDLAGRGYRVVYTREKDRSIELEERTAIAEAARGDLFVSIHANASRRRATQGIETYYLDEDHERHSLDIAARENGLRREELDALQRTMARLRASESSHHSRRLATVVQEQLVAGLPSRYRPVQDLGVKKGPFYVLFLSNMPAILVEVGFLTNRDEARRLRDPGYLEAVAEQIATGLAMYGEGTPTVALRGGP